MTAPLPPLPLTLYQLRLSAEQMISIQDYAKLAVREALERVKSGTMVYELHNEMIIKAVPIRHIESVIEEYK